MFGSVIQAKSSRQFEFWIVCLMIEIFDDDPTLHVRSLSYLDQEPNFQNLTHFHRNDIRIAIVHDPSVNEDTRGIKD